VKYYKCKIKGCNFESGSRKVIRTHAKVEHFKMCNKQRDGKPKLPSDITASYTSIDLE
jgi:hypothetical protein